METWTNSTKTDQLTIEQLIKIYTQIETERNQHLRDFWKANGFDFDRGDLLIVNENIIPVEKIPNHKQIKSSKHLFGDVAGIFVRNEFNSMI